METHWFLKQTCDPSSDLTMSQREGGAVAMALAGTALWTAACCGTREMKEMKGFVSTFDL